MELEDVSKNAQGSGNERGNFMVMCKINKTLEKYSLHIFVVVVYLTFVVLLLSGNQVSPFEVLLAVATVMVLSTTIKASKSELKRNQLELLYYPLLQLIEKSEKSSENLKNDARALYRYQYLILHNDNGEGNGNKITKFFSELESTEEGKISVKLQDVKTKVKDDIDTITSKLRPL